MIMCRGDIAHKFTDKPVFCAPVRSVLGGPVRTRCTPRRHRSSRIFTTVYAARAAYERAGIGPEDVDIAQLQDTDAGAEVIHMAETGLCKDGEQEQLLAEGATEIDGSIPVNTDGGLIANGEPIGASGLRQMHELVKQLRGECGDRQVPGNPRVAWPRCTARPELRRRRSSRCDNAVHLILSETIGSDGDVGGGPLKDVAVAAERSGFDAGLP